MRGHDSSRHSGVAYAFNQFWALVHVDKTNQSHYIDDNASDNVVIPIPGRILGQCDPSLKGLETCEGNGGND